MSGRTYGGRGRGGRGCGGRGKGRQGGCGSYNNKNKHTYKFNPHGTGRGQQTHIYDTVKKEIVAYVQKTYEYSGDIAKCLQYEVITDLAEEMPKLRKSKESDDEKKKQEDATFERIYNEKIKCFVTREDT